MRFILSFIVLLAFATPSIAAENNDAPKPSLVKGSKSYQVRYAKPVKGPESIEPAAGVEMSSPKIENKSALADSSSDEKQSSKKMMLHGKK